MNRWIAYSVCFILLVAEGWSLTLSEKKDTIDYLIRKAQEVLKIGKIGLGVGVFYNDSVVFAEGHGARNFTDGPSQANNRTIFAIGSCTKSFTSYACNDLVTKDGTLDWNDRVVIHIPEFRMSNHHTTDHITVRDLLSHASGLPRHQILQLNSNFPREELLIRIPYLETNFELREVFQYNNIMITVAGLVIQRVTGRTWERIVHERFFKPLDMGRTFAEVSEVLKSGDENVAAPHSIPRGFGTEGIQNVPFLDIHNGNPAGGIYSCVDDMLKFVKAQLRLTGRSREMHVSQINIPYEPATGPYFAHGLGWFLAYYRNHILLWHDGSINGFSSTVFMVPELDLGIVVLSNLITLSGFVGSLAYKIADIMSGQPSAQADLDAWVSAQAQGMAASQAATVWDLRNVAPNETIADPKQYVGYYENKGYGIVHVFVRGTELYAKYNLLQYHLVPKIAPHYFSARVPFPDEYRYECSFEQDASGRWVGFSIALEPTLSPMHFAKQASPKECKPKYLEPFVRQYGPFTITLNYFKRVLMATGGTVQYTGELTPHKPDWFSLRHVLLNFIRVNGTVSSLQLHQSELIFNFRKSPIT